MRNITFDDSSVLQEFAKIAAKQGLIKEAAVPDMQAKYNEAIKAIDEAFTKVQNDAGEKIIDRNYAAKAYQTALSGIVSKYPNLRAKLVQYANATTSNQYNMKADDMITTAAASKEYNVSGETGEQLIDSAHPQGSPKITGVKTTDVVETVVDQQKEDIKVVMKTPTGKYASRFTEEEILSMPKPHESVFEKYQKEDVWGIGEYIKQLTQEHPDVWKRVAEDTGIVEEVIQHYLNNETSKYATLYTQLRTAGATDEEILTVKAALNDLAVDDTLVSLADHFDSLGLYSYADDIDALLKKKSTVDVAKKYIDTIYGQVRDQINALDARSFADQIMGYYNTNKPTSLHKTMLDVDGMLKQWAKTPSYGQISVIVDRAKSAQNEDLIKERSVEGPTNPKARFEGQDKVPLFKKLYVEYLKETNPSAVADYPVDKDWGNARFNGIWKEMGGLEGITRKLSDAKMQKGKLVEV